MLRLLSLEHPPTARLQRQLQHDDRRAGLAARSTVCACRDDVSLVSFDDVPLFRLHEPGITAIAQPIDKIAETITGLLGVAASRRRQPGTRRTPSRSTATSSCAARRGAPAAAVGAGKVSRWHRSNSSNVSKSFGAVRRDRGAEPRIPTAPSRSSSVRPAAASRPCCASSRGWRTLTGGDIEIGGRNVNKADPIERGVAMVFQNYALYPHMTVEQNIGFSLRMARVAQGGDRRARRRSRRARCRWKSC